MKFGKQENISGIDFTLPEASFLIEKTNREQRPPLRIYLGTTGWTHKEWKGTFYPEKMEAGRQLAYYGRLCNTIELNTTHYRIPPKEMILKWVSMVPSDFKFCPKVLQYISHSRNLGVDSDRIDRFCTHMRFFGQHLGPVFLQLPPHFDTSKLPVLERFLDVFPEDIQLSIELRHPSWFDEWKQIDMLIAILTEQKRGLVITDVAGRRDVAHMQIIAPHLMVRFVGNGGHPSDRERLDQWRDMINGATGYQLDELYFFAHQPGQVPLQVLHDMMYLDETFRNNKMVETRGPVRINQQKSLFEL